MTEQPSENIDPFGEELVPASLHPWQEWVLEHAAGPSATFRTVILCARQDTTAALKQWREITGGDAD